MSLRFTVLASGSAGNSSLLEADGFGLLLDLGLGPRQLADRLRAIGAGWHSVHAALLTHTHGDHWNDLTLGRMRERRIPLYCHPDHHQALLGQGPGFAGMCSDGLVRLYTPGVEMPLGRGVQCRPLPLRHDGGTTCGFRLEGGPDGQGWALGYAADLGSWQTDLARALAGVDVLALEFNHDVGLERASGRSPRLIARVLGDDGHLSNFQAGELLREVLRLSPPGRLRHLIQLHLSRDCNRPLLAAQTASAVLAREGHQVAVHTAEQDRPCRPITVGGPDGSPILPLPRPRSLGPRRPRAAPPVRPWLPGWEE